MSQFIATFHTQYGAVQFQKNAKKNQIPCRLAPVPRTLSSSCGTCAYYESEHWDPGFPLKDLEIIYKPSDNGYEVVFEGE